MKKTGAHSSFEIINDCDKSLNLVIAKIVFDVTSMTTIHKLMKISIVFPNSVGHIRNSVGHIW